MNTIEKMIYQLNQKGISPTKMMRDLGFSSGLFSQWKKGLQNPSIEKIKSIADYLNVPVDYLIDANCTEKSCTQSDSIQNSIKNPPANAEGTRITKEQWEIAVSQLSLENQLRLRDYLELLVAKQVLDGQADR